MEITADDIADAATEHLVLLAITVGRTAAQGGALDVFLRRQVVAIAKAIGEHRSDEEAALDPRIRMVYHQVVVDCSGDLLIDGRG